MKHQKHLVMRLAFEKVYICRPEHNEDVVIGADTVVV